MKKSLLALAVLGAFAGAASAQSSVTIYGTVDLNARYVKNDGTSRAYSLSQDGINSSQLGFKGTEDLGGGLKASFDLRGGVNPDTGTANSKFWNRRSTVSLLGNFGEVRLGRDYTASVWNQLAFDALGTNGVGGGLNVVQKYIGTRRDNSIGYFLPSGIGGVYGQFMAAAAENGTTADRAGRYVGGRVGFAAGPVDVAAAYGQQKFSSGAADQKSYNVGGQYNFGVVTLIGYLGRETQASDKESVYNISAVVPIGVSEIHVAYDLSKRDNAGATTKIDQMALGYVYNLSKRTAVYSTVSRLNNKNLTTFSVNGGTITAGGKSTGAEFGLRHFF